MSKGLCDSCKKVDGCVIKYAGGITKQCSDYDALLSDKQRVERAKGEIEAIITHLNDECDMTVAAVSVQIDKALDADGRVAKMIGIRTTIYLE